MEAGDQAGLSVSETAQVLGVSRQTVCRWSDMAYLEASRNERGERRFSREQIDRFVRLLERQHVDPRIHRKPG
jgi:excisionase family DNA binding protein